MRKLVRWVGSTFSSWLLTQMHVSRNSNAQVDLKVGSPAALGGVGCRSGSSFVSALWVGMGRISASGRTRCEPSQIRSRGIQIPSLFLFGKTPIAEPLCSREKPMAVDMAYDRSLVPGGRSP